MIFAPKKAENTWIFSKFAKNELKGVKVAVLATLLNVSDSHGNSRGLEGPLLGEGGKGGVLYMEKNSSLELLKNHF